MTFNCQRSKQHKGRLNWTCQADPLVISKYTNWKKLLVVGREKRSILQDRVKCLLHLRSEVKLDTFVNSALFRFTKGLVLRSTIQWQTTKTIYRQFLQSGAQDIIYGVKPSVRIYYGVEHSKELLSIFILWLRSAFLSRDMTMYLFYQHLLLDQPPYQQLQNFCVFNSEVRHHRCVSNKSECSVYTICRQTQLSTRWYANLLNVNLNYMFRPQS